MTLLTVGAESRANTIAQTIATVLVGASGERSGSTVCRLACTEGIAAGQELADLVGDIGWALMIGPDQHERPDSVRAVGGFPPCGAFGDNAPPVAGATCMLLLRKGFRDEGRVLTCHWAAKPVAGRET